MKPLLSLHLPMTCVFCESAPHGFEPEGLCIFNKKWLQNLSAALRQSVSQHHFGAS